MATIGKKGIFERQMGRPKHGALSSFAPEIGEKIKVIRGQRSGWGADSIIDELINHHGFKLAQLPSLASINRFLNEQGLIPVRTPRVALPSSERCEQKTVTAHEIWQMDAQGSIPIQGLSSHAMINVKDVFSKVHCMAFPVPVKNSNTQPAGWHYQWALRLAFSEWGLPQRIQVDKDSVFMDSKSPSPFPSLVHLWLIGLGVELCFIKQAPPQENAMIERSHQTIERQVVQGQAYGSWQALWQACQQRRNRLNRFLPNRMLGRKAPLVCFPKAIHSGRSYNIDKEQQLFLLDRVHAFLARCVWYRKVSKSRTVTLGGRVYYLSKAKPQTELQIGFCTQKEKLIFRDINEQIIDQKVLRNLSFEDIVKSSLPQLLKTYTQLKSSQHCPMIT